MMDLLLRLISCVEPATLRQEVLNVRTCCFFLFHIGIEAVCLLKGCHPVGQLLGERICSSENCFSGC